MVEKSLSVDNLFVFVIIMTTFAVPAEHQPRALAIGIALALVLRAIFIAAGAALLAAFSFMFLIFGLALIATAVQLFRHRDRDPPSVGDNALLKLARRRLPLSDRYDGGRIVTRVNGRRMLTPLFMVLLAIGTTDFLFALDSIPAVYGVTRHSGVYRARRECVRAARPARAVLPRVGTARSTRVPVDGPVGDPHPSSASSWSCISRTCTTTPVPELSTPVSLAVIVVVLAVTTVAEPGVAVRREPRRTVRTRDRCARPTLRQAGRRIHASPHGRGEPRRVILFETFERTRSR